MTFMQLTAEESLSPAGADRANDTVADLAVHSKKTGEGSVFFCIFGEKNDGHAYAEEAYQNGCRLFVTEHPVALPPDAGVYISSNVRRTLASLSARFFGYPAKKLCLIGVTGTKGKTTTAHMIRKLLESEGVPCAYIGSDGFLAGGRCEPLPNTTPDSLTLNRYFSILLYMGIRTAVMEVSSQALMTYRVYGLHFSVCVFTNLYRDHIGRGEHRCFREYREAKLSLFREYGCETAVVNVASPVYRIIRREGRVGRIISFGYGCRADYTGKNAGAFRNGRELMTSFTVTHHGETGKTVLPLAGKHYIENFVAALAVVCEMRGSRIDAGLPCAKEMKIPGRCETIPVSLPGLYVLDYAHNGAGLRAALLGLRPYASGKLWCLFGAVGGHAECRRSDMARAACKYADLSVITEDNPDGEDVLEICRSIYQAFPDKSVARIIPDRAEAIRYIAEHAEEGDVILLAGKGNENYQLRSGRRVFFSEREILRSLSDEENEKQKKRIFF